VEVAQASREVKEAEDGVEEVRLWGATISYLGYAPGQTEVATFEYTAEFAESGIQVSPLQMIAPARIHSFPDISQ